MRIKTSQYDQIADKYDGLFLGEDSLSENREVAGMIGLKPGESVFDIGCGTGLLVEIASVPPIMYIGIDPSRKMLDRFRHKHPQYAERMFNVCFDGQADVPLVDAIVSLFGAASYLEKDALLNIARADSRLFLMFYKPDYFPVTYKKCGVDFQHFIYTKAQLEAIFGAGTAREWHNFIIIDKTKIGMQIQRIKLAELLPNTGQVPGLPSNPRQWTQTDIDKIAASLKETPELFEARPIIAYPFEGKYIILGGNLRYEGCRKNKDKDAPVFVLPESTPMEKLKEIVIKDNGSFGAWDYDSLANEWDDLDLAGWGVPAWAAPNFSPNLNPVDGVDPVTDEDIEAAGAHIKDELTPGEVDVVEVVCPHCGKTFKVKI